MKAQRILLVSIIAIAAAMLFTVPQALMAQYSCSPEALQNHSCAEFGDGAAIVEFLGSNNEPICTGVPGYQGPCTKYDYSYSGINTGQIDVAIPLEFTTELTAATTDNALPNCEHWYIDGGGDPSSKFGANFYNFGICSLSSNQGTGSIFTIIAEPSSADPDHPLAWQVRYSKNGESGALLQGPSTEKSVISTTSASLTSRDGFTVNYSIENGVVNVGPTNSNIAQAYPVSDAKLCLKIKPPENATLDWDPSGDDPLAQNINGDWYHCETIDYGSQDCDIKTTGSDPCRFLSGYMLCF